MNATTNTTATNATQTETATKTSGHAPAARVRAYLVAAVVVVLACLASWALFGSTAGLTTLPLAAIFLGMAFQERQQARTAKAKG